MVVMLAVVVVVVVVVVVAQWVGGAIYVPIDRRRTDGIEKSRNENKQLDRQTDRQIDRVACQSHISCAYISPRKRRQNNNK